MVCFVLEITESKMLFMLIVALNSFRSIELILVCVYTSHNIGFMIFIYFKLIFW